MTMIGAMAMPVNFRYRDVFLKGRPRHDRFDSFRRRHPSMDVGRRAKIFAPFDALKGFNEAVAAKDILYRDKEVPGEEDSAELNRRQYRTVSGICRNVDAEVTNTILVGETRISLEDVKKIEIESPENFSVPPFN